MLRALNLDEDFRNIVHAVGVDAWSKLRGKQILLTGGTGFFGKWLVSTWNAANKNFVLDSRLTVVSRDPDRFLALNPSFREISHLSFIKGDAGSFKYREASCDFVIQAAADLDPKRSLELPGRAFSACRKMIDFCDRYRPTDLLFVSSGAVYAPNANGHIRESDSIVEPAAAPPYSLAKVLSEWMLTQSSGMQNTNVKIARCFAFGGPFFPLGSSFALSSLLQNALSESVLTVTGDGTALRSYMDAYDLTIWLWTILLKAEAASVYNVGSDCEVSIHDLAYEIAVAYAGKTLEVRTERKAVAGLAPGRYLPSIEKAKHELGLKLTIDRATMIRRTLQFHLDQIAEMTDDK